MKIKLAGLLILFLFLGAGRVRAVLAVAYFTLNPAVQTYEQGSNFSVLVGVNSGGEGILGIDVEGTFDASKLELSSISKVEGAIICTFLECNFTDPTRATFDNSAGTFRVTVPSVGMSPYLAEAGNEDFMRLNFRAKAAGVASVNFTCVTGETTDTNVVNGSALDIVACASNQSGSYTITAVGGNTGAVSTTVPTTAATGSTSTPTSAAQLPETGGVAGTVGMVVFGIVSVLGALMVRWL
ncbi:hypothetical protein KJ909_02470 [Patescibacteria group bacterium]|nr:hypothetical protein [Patescibacteria group bacterium]